MGGTGKTPMVDYLVDLFEIKEVAVLSRGYGRKTKGTVLVETTSIVEDCGDEPLLLKKKHPKLSVLVDEKRSRGLEYLRREHPEIKMVILDDAMQHRKVKADFYLLLTTWANPFHTDYLLPAGNLRDVKQRSKSAQAIVVTKTDRESSPEQRAVLRSKLGTAGQKVFFSSISYGDICTLNGGSEMPSTISKVVLVTAIANPYLFEKEAEQRFSVLRHFKFNDHHFFTTPELFKLRNFIDTFEPQKPVILTTEKDAQRLKVFESFFDENQLEVYYWKIRTDFGADTEEFNSMIRSI